MKNHIAPYLKMSPTELKQACECLDDDRYCQACFISAARDAGIPDSVISGESRLSDHFSPEYIAKQIDPNGIEEKEEA